MTTRRAGERSPAGARGVAWLGCAFALGACSIEAPQGEVGVYAARVTDSGPASSSDGILTTTEAGTPSPPRTVTLGLTVRDFKSYDPADPTTNPAFDNGSSERSVVDARLGPDRKPVYRAPANTVPTYGKAYFDQWYRDVPGTNITVIYPLTLTLTADGQYEYDSRKSGFADMSTGIARNVFTPIDDGTPYATEFGNQGKPHNYCFTGELHAIFTLKPEGGLLRFRSDDDAYVFLDGKLVIDLGGTHAATGRELDVESLGLTVGQDYALDVFYAERLGKTGDLLLTTTFEIRPDAIR